MWIFCWGLKYIKFKQPSAGCEPFVFWGKTNFFFYNFSMKPKNFGFKSLNAKWRYGAGGDLLLLKKKLFVKNVFEPDETVSSHKRTQLLRYCAAAFGEFLTFFFILSLLFEIFFCFSLLLILSNFHS